MSKVWLVTGCSRGLGRAIAEVALETGDRVVATARHPERLRDLVDRYGDAVLPQELDVTDSEAATRAVGQAVAVMGRVDVVVNSAGYSDIGSFEDTTLDSFRTQIETNFFGVVNVSKAVVPVLREQGSGHIFQVSSLSARLAGPGLIAYQAAKWAISGFSLGLADEIAPFGVKLTVLEPGGMRTDWAGSSMHTQPPSAPYRATIGPLSEAIRATSGHEATDPRRVAELIHDLAGRPDAPARLLLGADAVPLAQERARELAADDHTWREVSMSVSDEPAPTTATTTGASTSASRPQRLRILEGRYVLERAVPEVVNIPDDVLAVVRGPDGGALMRRHAASNDAWIALWNGDAAHPPDATGMLASIVAPLAAGNLPVWSVASFDGDIVLVPADRVDEAAALLRRAGHQVDTPTSGP